MFETSDVQRGTSDAATSDKPNEPIKNNRSIWPNKAHTEAKRYVVSNIGGMGGKGRYRRTPPDSNYWCNMTFLIGINEHDTDYIFIYI